MQGERFDEVAIEMAFVVAAAHAALKAQVARINALNVYPVPDGDTGTNMLLTLESILEETSGKTYETPQAATRAGARAALMGARGNSGVILSQMIRGACEVLAERTALTPEGFAAALEGAWERAYASVARPVEGTMLTVIKDAAEAARVALEAPSSPDLATVVGVAVGEAHASVRRTPELLGVLRDAGVVDAGGLGVAAVLDGIYACVTGQKDLEQGQEEKDRTPDLDAIHALDEAWGYCTEFVLTGFSGNPRELEQRIDSCGKSVLVVADEDLVKVHLHTQDPGAALSYAGGFGRLAGVKVEDMEAQVHARAEGSGDAEEPPKELGVVVASRGEGNRELFERMGAIVIEGGQGSNPSAADFARAVEETRARSVVLLPNNRNIVPTADQVHGLVEAEVHVVRTTTIAAGLATMVGFDAEGEKEEVLEEMCEIAGSVRSAEIACSVRDARVGERDVPEGAYLALLDGELFAVEGSLEEAALRLAEEMLGGADVVTLVGGKDLDEELLRRIAENIRALDDAIEVEVRDGGQPLYPLQMVAE